MGPGLTPVFSIRKGITPHRPTIRAWIQGPYGKEFLLRLQAGGKRKARTGTRSHWIPGGRRGRGQPNLRLLRGFASVPASRGRRRAGTLGGARRLLRVGGAGRGQWAVRGALCTAAPSAGPRCTVSVKLQQLTGHRNLITRPCPFPTPLGPGDPPARGRRGAKTAPCKTGEGWGRCTEVSWLRDAAASPFPACCSPCPLQGAAILVPYDYLKCQLLLLFCGEGWGIYSILSWPSEKPSNLGCHTSPGRVFPFCLTPEFPTQG